MVIRKVSTKENKPNSCFQEAIESTEAKDTLSPIHLYLFLLAHYELQEDILNLKFRALNPFL